eukprot:Colp12_sorted_trinity150504_noHs@3736
MIVEGKNRALEAVFATVAYGICSMGMIYSNKFVLSTYHFEYPSAFLSIQAIIAVFLLEFMGKFGLVKVEPLRTETMKKWLPVTAIFCAMLYTSTQSLAYLTIPVVTVFKNCTNLLVAYGDKYFYGQQVSFGVLCSLLLMVVGSIVSGYTDLSFNLVGYIWMTLNCVATAAYALYLRRAKKTTELGEWGMALYNNFLTAAFLLPASILAGESEGVMNFRGWNDPPFLTALIGSGLVGTGLSLSVFWLVGVTSPTTYSIIGSLNKIPLTVVSVLFFDTPMTPGGQISIAFGLLSGVFFAIAKNRERENQQKGRVEVSKA